MQTLFTAMLTLFAKLHLRRFRPRIIGITGNAGKTSTRHAVAAVLAAKYRVRSPAANMNTDLGAAAAIIGDFSRQYDRTGGSPSFWFGVCVRGLTGWLGHRAHYPEVLVMEYGADRPGDIKRLARRFPPRIAVVTQVGEVPVHVEFFASPQELAAEKAQLVRAVPADGHAVLNYDDQTVLDMRSTSPASDTTFGGGAGADVQYTDLRTRLDGQGMPVGASFNVTVAGATMPVSVTGTFGRGIAAASAAAVAVGRAMGVGLADACDALSRMHPPSGRMRILGGIKDAVVIDDTYNASPAAVHLAIDTVAGLTGRKLLVLGDMRELGEHRLQAHQALGTRAATVADELVCVGEGGRLVAEAASNQMSSDRIHWFDDSRQAAPAVQRLLRRGDIVLVKGSQGMRMERVVKEIMAEPQRAGTLLVRQSARWLRK